MNSPFEQLKAGRLAVFVVLTVSGILLGTVLLLHFWKGVPIGNLTRDPTAIVGAPFYLGFLSQIGVFLWSASAAICIFSAAVVPENLENLDMKLFLIASGLLTLVLGLDDLFLLHEQFLPRIGVPEKAVLASYAGFVLFYLVRFHATIVKTEYIFLAMALLFFGLSVGLDVISAEGTDPYLFEDGSKMVGIVSWLAYFFRAAVSALHQTPARQGASSD